MKIDEIVNTDKLAETPFSQLFHEARTTSRRHYTSVSVPVKIQANEIETGSVVKTRRGEHYHVRNTSWDGVVSLSIQPFMETTVAKQELRHQLRDLM